MGDDARENVITDFDEYVEDDEGAVIITAEAEKLVLESVIRPSKRFGKILSEVDHAHLGQLLRSRRFVANVQAVMVAKKLGIAKTTLHFLENGERQWNMRLVKAYLKAVSQLEKRRSKSNGHHSTVIPNNYDGKMKFR